MTGQAVVTRVENGFILRDEISDPRLLDSSKLKVAETVDSLVKLVEEWASLPNESE